MDTPRDLSSGDSRSRQIANGHKPKLVYECELIGALEEPAVPLARQVAKCIKKRPCIEPCDGTMSPLTWGHAEGGAYQMIIRTLESKRCQAAGSALSQEASVTCLVLRTQHLATSAPRCRTASAHPTTLRTSIWSRNAV